MLSLKKLDWSADTFTLNATISPLSAQWQTISIEECVITDLTLTAILSTCRLFDLAKTSCTHLAFNAPVLTELSINDCLQLKSLKIETPILRTLSLINCPELTLENLQSLSPSTMKVDRVDIRHCEKIDYALWLIIWPALLQKIDALLALPPLVAQRLREDFPEPWTADKLNPQKMIRWINEHFKTLASPFSEALKIGIQQRLSAKKSEEHFLACSTLVALKINSEPVIQAVAKQCTEYRYGVSYGTDDTDGEDIKLLKSYLNNAPTPLSEELIELLYSILKKPYMKKRAIHILNEPKLIFLWKHPKFVPLFTELLNNKDVNLEVASGLMLYGAGSAASWAEQWLSHCKDSKEFSYLYENFLRMFPLAATKIKLGDSLIKLLTAFLKVALSGLKKTVSDFMPIAREIAALLSPPITEYIAPSSDEHWYSFFKEALAADIPFSSAFFSRLMGQSPKIDYKILRLLNLINSKYPLLLPDTQISNLLKAASILTVLRDTDYGNNTLAYTLETEFATGLLKASQMVNEPMVNSLMTIQGQASKAVIATSLLRTIGWFDSCVKRSTPEGLREPKKRLYNVFNAAFKNNPFMNTLQHWVEKHTAVAEWVALFKASKDIYRHATALIILPEKMTVSDIEWLCNCCTDVETHAWGLLLLELVLDRMIEKLDKKSVTTLLQHSAITKTFSTILDDIDENNTNLLQTLHCLSKYHVFMGATELTPLTEIFINLLSHDDVIIRLMTLSCTQELLATRPELIIFKERMKEKCLILLNNETSLSSSMTYSVFNLFFCCHLNTPDCLNALYGKIKMFDFDKVDDKTVLENVRFFLKLDTERKFHAGLLEIISATMTKASTLITNLRSRPQICVYFADTENYRSVPIDRQMPPKLSAIWEILQAMNSKPVGVFSDLIWAILNQQNITIVPSYEGLDSVEYRNTTMHVNQPLIDLQIAAMKYCVAINYEPPKLMAILQGILTGTRQFIDLDIYQKVMKHTERYHRETMYVHSLGFSYYETMLECLLDLVAKHPRYCSDAATTIISMLKKVSPLPVDQLEALGFRFRDKSGSLGRLVKILNEASAKAIRESDKMLQTKNTPLQDIALHILRHLSTNIVDIDANAEAILFALDKLDDKMSADTGHQAVLANFLKTSHSTVLNAVLTILGRHDDLSDTILTDIIIYGIIHQPPEKFQPTPFLNLIAQDKRFVSLLISKMSEAPNVLWLLGFIKAPDAAIIGRLQVALKSRTENMRIQALKGLWQLASQESESPLNPVQQFLHNVLMPLEHHKTTITLGLDIPGLLVFSSAPPESIPSITSSVIVHSSTRTNRKWP